MFGSCCAKSDQWFKIKSVLAWPLLVHFLALNTFLQNFSQVNKNDSSVKRPQIFHTIYYFTQDVTRPHCHGLEIPNIRMQGACNDWYSINTLRQIKVVAIPQTLLASAFFNENVWISLNISLNFVPNVRINNLPLLIHRRQTIIWTNYGRFTDEFMRHSGSMI